MEETIIEAREFAYFLLRAAMDKKAMEPVLLDVSGLASYADYFVICSGSSSRQVQAITEWVETKAREAGFHALSIEGLSSGKWVLMDFGSVLIHIFFDPVRVFYDLEGLWADAPRLPVPLGERSLRSADGLAASSPRAIIP